MPRQLAFKIANLTDISVMFCRQTLDNLTGITDENQIIKEYIFNDCSGEF